MLQVSDRDAARDLFSLEKRWIGLSLHRELAGYCDARFWQAMTQLHLSTFIPELLPLLYESEVPELPEVFRSTCSLLSAGRARVLHTPQSMHVIVSVPRTDG